MKDPEKTVDLQAMEKQLHEEGFELICGVDEAGRGPLAGPVCAAAVILPRDIEIAGLNDSKKLSEKKREALFDEICEKALAYGIAFASVEEIESINILSAALLAMNRAIAQLPEPVDLALIDGNTTRDIQVPARAVIGGDGRCACIAAASILAKVTRDRWMRDMAKQYPEYSFEKHKGYGTKAHYEALELHGPCPIHRMSFLKKFYEKRS